MREPVSAIIPARARRPAELERAMQASGPIERKKIMFEDHGSEPKQIRLVATLKTPRGAQTAALGSKRGLYHKTSAQPSKINSLYEIGSDTGDTALTHVTI